MTLLAKQRHRAGGESARELIPLQDVQARSNRSLRDRFALRKESLPVFRPCGRSGRRCATAGE
jgi:hypothetical protein